MGCKPVWIQDGRWGAIPAFFLRRIPSRHPPLGGRAIAYGHGHDPVTPAERHLPLAGEVPISGPNTPLIAGDAVNVNIPPHKDERDDGWSMPKICAASGTNPPAFG